MQQIPLNATRREGLGKGVSRQLRAVGQVPAVIYSAGQPALSLAVAATDLEKVLRQVSGDLAFLALTVDQDAPRMALLKELSHDNMGRRMMHVDFYEVRPDQKMTVEVPLEFTGEAKGINLGGVLNVAVHNVSLRGLLQDLPGSLTVDVTGLELGMSIHVADLPLPAGVEALLEDSSLIVACAAPAKAEVAAPVEGEEIAEAKPAAGKAPAKDKGKKGK
jgi:large subunit ribosomal protein L25